MAQLTALFFPTLRQIHEHMLASGIERIQRHDLGEQDNETEELELALLAFKSLWKMVLYGYREPHKEPTARVRLHMKVSRWKFCLFLWMFPGLLGSWLDQNVVTCRSSSFASVDCTRHGSKSNFDMLDKADHLDR